MRKWRRYSQFFFIACKRQWTRLVTLGGERDEVPLLPPLLAVGLDGTHRAASPTANSRVAHLPQARVRR